MMNKTVIYDCTIYNCDFREMLATIEPVDLVVTDPPYGCNYKTRHRHASDRPKPLAFDDKPHLEFVPYIVNAVKPNSAIYLCTRFAEYSLWEQALKDAGATIETTIVWDKGNWTAVTFMAISAIKLSYYYLLTSVVRRCDKADRRTSGRSHANAILGIRRQSPLNCFAVAFSTAAMSVILCLTRSSAAELQRLPVSSPVADLSAVKSTVVTLTCRANALQGYIRNSTHNYPA